MKKSYKLLLSFLCFFVGALNCMADGHTWDFTNWSEATIANLKVATEWSDDEKGDGTNVTNGNCYWQVEAGNLKANNTAIAELEGLTFTNTSKRSLAIALNYPSTSLGTYHGSQYLWLGSKNIAYFTIPNVKPGSVIKMGVESHKNSDARGVKLTIDGTELVGTDGNAVAVPTTYVDQEWQVPTSDAKAVNVVVTNTNGCHLYYIDAEIVDPNEYEYTEKVIYKTNFQDWEDVKASTTETTVTKTTTDGNNIKFTLFNTALDNDGTNDKFTGDDVTPGYLQTQKDATNVPYVIISDIPSVTQFSIYQAATGGNRGATVYVKGTQEDGTVDTDWVELHNASISTAKGEYINCTGVNRTDCSIKIGAYDPSQNAYVLSMSISGNVKTIKRTFTDFAVDFTSDPYTVTTPADGTLPSGVSITGTWHDNQHGYGSAVATVPVDGPVLVTIGGCQYSGTATVAVDGTVVSTLDTKTAGCSGVVTYRYNKEAAATLTINCGSYCPSLKVEKTDYVNNCVITYYDSDAKTVLGQDTVEGSSKLTYKYGASDVTVADGYAFRGWFNGKTSTAIKVKEGTEMSEDTKLYAKTSPIENTTSVSRFEFDLTKSNFYDEDHEAIDLSEGSYYNTHGWIFGKGKSIKVPVGGKAYIIIKNCQYSSEQTATVTDSKGNEVGTFTTPAENDGDATTIQYGGEADTLTITFPSGAYVHGVSIYNVVDFIAYDETTGYYQVPANDVNSFILALSAANSKGNAKIFLPNGTYDLGETVLTQISGNNISIIGESEDGTIIKNAPLVENEGIGTTATLLNTSSNLYMQDLTLQNALDYYAAGAAGRAVCLQDKGANTICKNVKMLSYQDTYYSNKASKFYWEDCEIHGTVDYLCGDGDVIYNRCKFVNESREKGKNSGSDCLSAPYQSASCTWGYVFLDCTVKTLSKDFSFARSWGGNSAAQFIRTTVDSLASSRFTAAGMKIAAYKFKEYKTMDYNGNVTTPASNVMTFTHSSGNLTYETVLSDDEASKYTVANIFGEWAPDATAKQVTSVADGTIFLVDGKITAVAPTSGNVRVANGRGGFGPTIDAATGINAAELATSASADKAIYNIAGQRVVKTQKGLYIQNGKKFVVK